MSAIRHVGASPGPSKRPLLNLLFCCALLALWAPAPALRAEGVRWRTDYAKALKEAGERGVPLLLNVGSENCFWCKQLDARTFVDEEISRLLNERCVPLKVDGNKNTYLVQALRVQSYPTLIFASHDGSILHYREGFQEAPVLKEQLGKVLASVGTPDWMQRDHDSAVKAVAAGDFPKAIPLLLNVVEDGKSRPVQAKARQILAELEKQAAERLAQARELADKGKAAEAITALEQLEKTYAGTQAARRGKQALVELTTRAEAGAAERRRQAAEVLKQAREDYASRQYLCCLDRCEMLTSRYRDLPEAAAAERLAGEIKEDPEQTKTACDQLGERLCRLYLSMADSWLSKGQPQQAIFYLERVVKMFPASKHAETAQGRLARLKGAPAPAAAAAAR